MNSKEKEKLVKEISDRIAEILRKEKQDYNNDAKEIAKLLNRAKENGLI